MERNAQRASSPTLKQLNPMNNTMHKVILHTDAEQLGELVGLVLLLPNTTLISTELVGQSDVVDIPVRVHTPPTRVTKRLPNKVNTDETERDPRLVYQVDDYGNARVDVAASLDALNLTKLDLGKMHTRCGTSEHRVKMAIVSNRRAALRAEETEGNGAIGPAELHGSILSNRGRNAN